MDRRKDDANETEGFDGRWKPGTGMIFALVGSCFAWILILFVISRCTG